MLSRTLIVEAITQQRKRVRRRGFFYNTQEDDYGLPKKTNGVKYDPKTHSKKSST